MGNIFTVFCQTFCSLSRKNGVFIFSFLDSDIVRLSRFRSAVSGREFEILCYLDQVSFLRKYLGNHVRLRLVEIDLVAAELIGGEEDQNEWQTSQGRDRNFRHTGLHGTALSGRAF